MAGDQTRLGLLILAVGDLPRALRFYTAAFGWRQVVDVPVYAEFELPGQLRLGLYQRTAFAANVGRAPVETPAAELAPTELYLYPEDLPAAIQRVTSAGARLLGALGPRAWGDEAAYFADPDGNVIALARPLGH